MKSKRFKLINEIHWDLWSLGILVGKGARTEVIYHDEYDDDYKGVWRDRKEVPVGLIGITIGPWSFGFDWRLSG